VQRTKDLTGVLRSRKDLVDLHNYMCMFLPIDPIEVTQEIGATIIFDPQKDLSAPETVDDIKDLIMTLGSRVELIDVYEYICKSLGIVPEEIPEEVEEPPSQSFKYHEDDLPCVPEAQIQEAGDQTFTKDHIEDLCLQGYTKSFENVEDDLDEDVFAFFYRGWAKCLRDGCPTLIQRSLLWIPDSESLFLKDENLTGARLGSASAKSFLQLRCGQTLTDGKEFRFLKHPRTKSSLFTLFVWFLIYLMNIMRRYDKEYP